MNTICQRVEGAAAAAAGAGTAVAELQPSDDVAATTAGLGAGTAAVAAVYG